MTTNASSPDSGTPAQLTHLDQEGAARMVEVGHKDVTRRRAKAQAILHMQPNTLQAILRQDLPKGDALQVARIAGILGAKRTPELIPLCHPLPLSGIDIDFVQQTESSIQVTAEVRNQARTGVEMEALTACALAALTLYDMAKALEPTIQITDLCLLEKDGGKHGEWARPHATSQGQDTQR